MDIGFSTSGTGIKFFLQQTVHAVPHFSLLLQTPDEAGVLIPSIDNVPGQFDHADFPDFTKANFLDIDFDGLGQFVFIAPDREAVVGFVAPMRRAGNIVGRWDWVTAVLSSIKLLRVGYDPHMDPLLSGKAPNLPEASTDIFRFGLATGPRVFEFIPRIDDEPADAMTGHKTLGHGQQTGNG